MPSLSRGTSVVHREISMALDGHLFDARSQEIRLMTPLAKRIAAQIVHQLVGVNPGAADALRQWPYAAQGMQTIGFGYFSSVIRVGDSVFKLNRPSRQLPYAEQLRQADSLQARQDAVCRALGSYAEDQVFSVVPDPFHRQGTIITAHQQFVDRFQPINLLRAETLRELDSPGLSQVSDFVDRVRTLHKTSGVIVDTKGQNNIGFDKDGVLKLVDTVPLDLTKQQSSTYLAWIENLDVAVNANID